ncbi:uncharacterized protein G2W53_041187 [Senna tora]|uniref:Uncharacterized protein n=1 Tax=Senna tora TaxID=362788 RepID=A0A834SFB2_9FABA|nr:uncharacterized protein G2W53_041187 [Senna tora]
MASTRQRLSGDGAHTPNCGLANYELLEGHFKFAGTSFYGQPPFLIFIINDLLL